ncbi:14573_t:CDS:2 [Funneliformis caledonium]|uniref:14573_t:CDS:1 n=1 Tax=Funneliformis caledonium TaxID=1117310 RepID=A0A9N9CTT4_9GLOM|nr:14573_t:CDS:2 [Funneliformis caledonium]
MSRALTCNYIALKLILKTLLRLPSEAEKFRLSKVNFTPKAKRVKYEIYST